MKANEPPFALSPDDHHFLVRLMLREPPLTVDAEREARLIEEGLVVRQFGQLMLTERARHLFGNAPKPG